MSDLEFETRQCSRESCRFRFPVVSGDSEGLACPSCGAPTKLIKVTPFSKEHPSSQPENGHIKVEGFLDNIRSAYNVGAIFRTADGSGVSHLHLGGITPKPFHPKVRKTALGAEKAIPWTHHKNGLDAVEDLKERGYKLWALENSTDACSLFSCRETMDFQDPTLLIVGNEISGVDRGILELCDRVIALPMVGSKSSLNVEVSFGIAAYYLRFFPI